MAATGSLKYVPSVLLHLRMKGQTMVQAGRDTWTSPTRMMPVVQDLSRYLRNRGALLSARDRPSLLNLGFALNLSIPDVDVNLTQDPRAEYNPLADDKKSNKSDVNMWPENLIVTDPEKASGKTCFMFMISSLHKPQNKPNPN